MNTIYEPKGAAREYAALALNIYNGCDCECTYCYVPSVLKKTREQFHSAIVEREGLLIETEKWLKRQPQVTPLTKATLFPQRPWVLLCFTCDPVGANEDIMWQYVQLFHEYGYPVEILTKKKIDIKKAAQVLLSLDRFGSTITCGDTMAKEWERKALPPSQRREQAKQLSRICPVWYSCEPVLDPNYIYKIMREDTWVSEYKVGKLNYMEEPIKYDKVEFVTNIIDSFPWNNELQGYYRGAQRVIFKNSLKPYIQNRY